MKKNVSANWEECRNPTNEECWRLVANFTGGNVRLGFINKACKGQYNPALDLCEGGILKVSFLKSVRSLEEAKRNVYETLFLNSMAESNMIEEIDFDWDTRVCPEYKDKTFTLVGKFPGRKIRFAHIRKDAGGKCVMFLNLCTKFPDAKCIGRVGDLDLAKESIVKKLSEG